MSSIDTIVPVAFSTIKPGVQPAFQIRPGSPSQTSQLVQTSPSSGNPSSFQWGFIEHGDGVYRIFNGYSGFVADLKGGNTKNGTPVDQYSTWGWSGSDPAKNQLWARTAGGSTFATALDKNKVWDISLKDSGSDGAGVQIYNVNGGANQSFSLPQGLTPVTFYRLRSLCTSTDGKALYASGQSPQQASRIALKANPTGGTDPRFWWGFILDDSKRYYRIFSGYSGFTVDAPNGSSKNDTPVNQYPTWKWSGNVPAQNQLWLWNGPLTQGTISTALDTNQVWDVSLPASEGDGVRLMRADSNASQQWALDLVK